MDDPPPLRYLSASDVAAAMPALPERLALAETTLLGLAGVAELPAKIGVHPRPEGSFGHAMPAYLPGDATDGSADRLGMKWVLGFSSNSARSLPAISALLLLNDPQTGIATAILDAGPITAQRTAAVSGVAVRAWATPADPARPRIALIGAGVQGHSHLPVLAHLLPSADIALFDRDASSAEALATEGRKLPAVGSIRVARSARAAVDEADVVVTAVSFAPPPERQTMTNDWLAPRALVVAVDYATMCAAEVARGAALFVTDHTDQFLANRDSGQFDGYPEPHAMMGAVLASGAPRPTGRMVVTHLGTGLADVVFGTAILLEAERRGLGTLLRR
jgi:ornithine cyclodeaminase/alanine dehydrogenase-like protein (mu-crystallin family)